MSDIFWTVFSGVAVFVLGQWVVRFVIDPLVAFKEELGRIQSLLLKNRQTIQNLYKDTEVAEEFALSAARIMAKRRAIPCYCFFNKIGLTPSASTVIKGFDKLNELHLDLLNGWHNTGKGAVYLRELGIIFEIPEIDPLHGKV